VRYVILLCVAGAGLSLAACGATRTDTDGGSTSPQSPQDAAANNGKALQFAQCMRSHGVPNFPDPTGGRIDLQVQRSPTGTSVNGVQVNGPAFQSAMKSCQSYLPKGAPPTAAETAKARSQALAMARCMRSHGVPNFPDPQVQAGPNGGVGVRIQIGGAGINPNPPAFGAAQKACGSIFGGAPTIAKAPG
jgi:hypothetical protein